MSHPLNAHRNVTNIQKAPTLSILVAGNETRDDEHQRRYADCQEERGGDRAWKTRPHR